MLVFLSCLCEFNMLYSEMSVLHIYYEQLYARSYPVYMAHLRHTYKIASLAVVAAINIVTSSSIIAAASTPALPHVVLRQDCPRPNIGPYQYASCMPEQDQWLSTVTHSTLVNFQPSRQEVDRF